MFRRRLTSLAAAGLLTLLLCSPAATAYAAPNAVPTTHVLLDWLLDSWADLAAAINSVTGNSDALPNADPDGYQPALTVSPEQPASQSQTDGGETFPNADPNG